MRTTIDLPDSLYREVKSTAAARGLKLKEFISESLRKTLEQSNTADSKVPTETELHRRRMQDFFKAIDYDSGQTGPVGPFNREELHDRHD